MNVILDKGGDVLKDKAGEARHKLGGAVQHTRDRFEVSVHRHPLETVIVSASAGLLLGVVLGFLTRRNGR